MNGRTHAGDALLKAESKAMERVEQLEPSPPIARDSPLLIKLQHDVHRRIAKSLVGVIELGFIALAAPVVWLLWNPSFVVL